MHILWGYISGIPSGMIGQNNSGPHQRPDNTVQVICVHIRDFQITKLFARSRIVNKKLDNVGNKLISSCLAQFYESLFHLFLYNRFRDHTVILLLRQKFLIELLSHVSMNTLE